MKRIIVLCFLLAGCAHDQYVALPGADTSHQAAILEDCRQQAYHRYFLSMGSTLGVPGGVIGGALSGALMGQHLTDKNADIAACMRAHGFEGHSEG